MRLPRRTVLLTGDTALLRSALDVLAPMGADTDRQAVASPHRIRATADRHDADVWVAQDPDDRTRSRRTGEIA